MLRAVEEVHRQHGASVAGAPSGASPAAGAAPSGQREGEGAGPAPGGGGGSSGRIPAGIASGGHLGSGSGRRLSKGQILNGYKAQLHEYRRAHSP